MAVAATGLGVPLALSSAGTDCAEVTTVRVAATSTLAPVLASVAPAVATRCERFQVEAVEAADVVDGLTDGSIRPPDVWVPDSSLWLDRAGVDALAEVGPAPSVASSPLVLAVTAATAGRLSADGEPTVEDLVRAASAGDLTLHTSDERLSPGRVGAVLALTAATADRPDARAALAGLLRAAVSTTSEPTLPDRDGIAVPVPEQAVHAAVLRGEQVTAVRPGTVEFDYPFAVLADDPEVAELAARLLEGLGSETSRAALRDAGLRPSADGGGALGPEALELAERTLVAVHQKARLLAVLDVSGSMGWGLRGRESAGPSRLSVATEAAGEGLSLYPDGTEVGLWLFPSRTGDAVQEVAPVRAVGDAADRTALGGVLAGLRPVPGGSTPLYDATLAAVDSQQEHWQDGAVNAVVLLTDGRDTVSATPLPRLLSRLESARDSDRPVPVITIAFGPDSDAATLAAISEASGGASYRASSAADVRRIFLDALGQRACRPDCR